MAEPYIDVLHKRLFQFGIKLKIQTLGYFFLQQGWLSYIILVDEQYLENPHVHYFYCVDLNSGVHFGINSLTSIGNSIVEIRQS